MKNNQEERNALLPKVRCVCVWPDVAESSALKQQGQEEEMIDGHKCVLCFIAARADLQKHLESQRELPTTENGVCRRGL